MTGGDWAGQPILDISPARASAVKVRYKLQNGTIESTTLDRLRPDDVLDGAPVRAFRAYPGRTHYSGYYWSSTLEQHVVYESLLEKSFLTLADFDPNVIGIAAQPMELTRDVGDKSYMRIPDFLLRYRTGEIRVVDVKPSRHLHEPSVAGPLEWTRRACEARGWEYEIWSRPATPIRFMNTVHLAGYRRRRFIDGDTVATVRQAVRGEESIRSLERRLCVGQGRPHALVRPAVLHLLWSGILATDLDRLLQADSLLQVVASR